MAGIRVEGNTSGNVAEVDTSNSVKVSTVAVGQPTVSLVSVEPILGGGGWGDYAQKGWSLDRIRYDDEEVLGLVMAFISIINHEKGIN